MFKPIDRWMYGQYDAIICISDQTRVNLERFIGHSNRVFTINNGVNTLRFQRQIKDISKNSQFIITMVAGLRAEKDHETLIKAMLSLPTNYHLQLVGHGEREAELKAFCDKNDLSTRVSFMGLRMDVPDVLLSKTIIGVKQIFCVSGITRHIAYFLLLSVVNPGYPEYNSASNS